MQPGNGNGMEKIEHLVIFMMENRSFDHYFGALARDPLYARAADIEGLNGTFPTYLNLENEEVLPRSLDGTYFGYDDLPHGPAPQTANYNNGQLDGFVKSYELDLRKNHPDWTEAQAAEAAKLAVAYYTRDTLPVLYALADNFTVCDHWFSSMLSSTWPNRKYLHSGRRDSDMDTQTLPAFPGFQTTPMWDVFEDTRDSHGNKHTWKNYFTDLPFLAFWYKFAAFHAFHNFTSIENFVTDCREDTLPTVSIIDPAFSLADDHPTHDVRMGQKFMGLVVDALTNSESWSKTALVITYDENGGFFDHVVPPAAFGGDTTDTPMGFRVPTVVISPYSKGAVCHTAFDHTSIMKSIAMRWGVNFDPAVFGPRYQSAPDIWTHCFNFNADPLPMGIYTEVPAHSNDVIKNLNWETDVHALMVNPIGDLEALLERMFVLPELKLLDRRNKVFEALNNMETNVVDLKRMNMVENQNS
jgi:phospholipase C